MAGFASRWLRGRENHAHRPRPEHEHTLEVIEVAHPRSAPFQPETTQILFGCTTCEHVEVRTVDGRWTIEQVQYLRRRPPEPPGEP